MLDAAARVAGDGTDEYEMLERLTAQGSGNADWSEKKKPGEAGLDRDGRRVAAKPRLRA